jgi:hypothetical protein
MPAILQPAEFQAIDANGHPLSGGTLATYVPNTSTPKPTYQDEGLSAQNTNPVVLDSSGRAILWGDGLYRCVLRDALGNLIYDQMSTTVVSAAMEAFALAPSLTEAQRLLGVTDAIDAAVAVESAARIAADNALGTRIDNEITRATNAETALGARIDAETAARIAADNALSDRIDAGSTAATGFVQVRSGIATTDGSGNVFIPFDPPFTTALTGAGNPWFNSELYVLVGWTESISGMGGQVLNNLPEGEPDTPAAFNTVNWWQMGF